MNNHAPGIFNNTSIMDPPVSNPDVIGLGTKLLRRACDQITGSDTRIANVWKGNPYPVYFRVEEVPSLYGYIPTTQVLYSNTSLAFCESAPPDASSPFTRPVALFGLLLLAALQPTGRILGRNASTPWVIRCFPILYIADTLAVLVSWMHLGWVSGNGIRHAASAIFEARNSGEGMEHWTFSLTKAKAAMPARWAAFWFGVALPLNDTFHSAASVQAKVLLSVYAVAWLVFEALVLAAEIDSDEDKTDSAEPAVLETADTPNGSDSPEQEEKPTLVPIPVEPESEPEPNTPTAPEDNHPSTRSATRDSSQIMRYFSTTAILVSAIYHIVPFALSEVAEWYGYLAGWHLAEPVDLPASSMFQLAEPVLSAIFWTVIAAQDLLVGEWLPTLGGEGDYTEELHMKWPIAAGLIWGYMEVVYRLLGESSEPEGGGGLWITAAIGGYVAVRWVGGEKGNIGVSMVDLFRVSVVVSAVIFYSEAAEGGISAVAKGFICRMGGLCRPLY